MPTNPTFLDRAGAVAGRLDNALRLGGIRFVKDTANGGWPAFVLAQSREDDDYFRAPTVAVKAPRGRVRIYVTYEGRNNEQREREIDPITDPTAVPEIVTRLREMGALIRIDGRDLGLALEGKLHTKVQRDPALPKQARRLREFIDFVVEKKGDARERALARHILGGPDGLERANDVLMGMGHFLEILRGEYEAAWRLAEKKG
jgi:hypothetical protein